MRYHLVTLGCQMNMADSEKVVATLNKMGYTHTEKEEEADVIGILACSVRQKAIDKVYGRITKWNKWKNNRELITFASGCILPDDKQKFLKLFDLVFDIAELEQLPDMMAQYGVSSQAANHMAFNIQKQQLNSFWRLPHEYQSPFEAFVPIQNGCDKFCSFCAVPYTRGREVSRPSGEILEEVKSLIEKGYKSITLLGQNVNSYGKDKNGEELDFRSLLERIGEMGDGMNGDFWLYFTSPHPRDMTSDIFETMAKYKCLAKQIHLPMQAGDDKILIKMNRKHSMSHYDAIVADFRRILPTATLFTDIIVGFTGEEEEHFENTRVAVKKHAFNMAYIAMYSPRPGAASHRWDDTVTQDEKKRRLAVLSGDLSEVSIVYNEQLMGKEVKVLVRGTDKASGFLSGHTEGKIVVRFASKNQKLVGQFVTLKITSVTPFSMEGELVG